MINKIICWTPRILAILFLLFLALFSLDVFDLRLGFWETACGLFMHNIPALILLIVLIFSWKRAIVGGLGFLSLGILFALRMAVNAIINHFEFLGLSQLIIAGPAFLIGILFLVSWFKNKQH